METSFIGIGSNHILRDMLKKKLKLRVCLDTDYFIKNWKQKTIKKIIKKLLFMCKLLFICLDELFMSHEQCIRCWSVKIKKGWNAKRPNVDVI